MRRFQSFCALVALAGWGVSALAAEPSGWLGFYRPSVVEQPIAVPAAVVAAQSVCIQAILAAQTRYNIPDNLLLAIGLQEAGRQVNGTLTVWPWTANARGKGKFFGSKQALEAWVRQTQSNVTQSVDVGCMQVNQKWHARQFDSLEEATDPVANVDYAARFLRSLYSETRDWWQAAGRYHSSTEDLKRIYLGKLEQNQKLAHAHLASFRRTAQATNAVPIPVAQEPRSVPAFGWTSDMTGTQRTAATQVLSIYSSEPLQALLPNYDEAD